MEIYHLMMSLLLGYLCGSIPFGLLLTRLSGLGDVRHIGSGNIGATNVLRMGNKKIAALTLLMDALKGTFIVTLMGIIDPYLAYTAGIAAVLGHVFPIWLKFKGGKGVATCLGVMLALSPLAALIGVAVWIISAALTRYSSLSALLAISVTPIVTLTMGNYPLTATCLILAALNIYTHRENIKRLLLKTEPKIGA